jgi:hypothetical protein
LEPLPVVFELLGFSVPLAVSFAVPEGFWLLLLSLLLSSLLSLLSPVASGFAEDVRAGCVLEGASEVLSLLLLLLSTPSHQYAIHSKRKKTPHTVILASKKHVLDISQAMNVVECMLHVHGMRNRRHGHDGSEDLRRPHLVQTMLTTSLVTSFGSNEAREITCTGEGKLVSRAG